MSSLGRVLSGVGACNSICFFKVYFLVVSELASFPI